jgi:hypothetical protein
MRKFLILLLIILPYCSLEAQNTTNSPTSQFGIGEIAYGEGGQYSGFGGAAISLRGGNFINYANPASLTALDSARFVFDMGLKGSYRIYRQTGADSRSFVGNVNNIGLGFRLTPMFYVGAFLTPITSCGYAVTMYQDVTGSTTGSKVSSLFEGTGGLSKVGLSGAALLFKKLSIGVSASYVSGTITQTETQSTASAELTSKKQAFYMDFGAQYQLNIDKKSSAMIGIVYGISQPLHQNNSLIASSSSGGSSVTTSPAHGKRYLPGYYGIGGSYTRDRWLFTADYRYYDWSKTETNESNIEYKNQNCLMLGAQRTFGNIYRYPVKLLLGAGVSNSYVVISGKKAENYYVSTGLNFVFKGGHALSVGFKYNDQFNSSKNMQKDRAISMFLNVSFNERVWHSKIQ